MLVAEDVIIVNGEPTQLYAYVGRQDLFSLRPNISKADVTFHVGARKIGPKAISKAGRASVDLRQTHGLPNLYHASTQVGDQTLEGTGRIFHWRQDRVILAVDLDYCIVETDYLRLLFGKHIPVSPPFPGAREALAELSKEYYVLYLTARPRSMLIRTREWLDHYGFPAAPIIVSDRFRDVLRQPEWKTDTLRDLQRQYPSLLVSVGNRKHDIQSAADNGILPIIVESSELNAEDGDGNVVLADWRAVSEFFRVNRQVLIQPSRLERGIQQGFTLMQPVADHRGQYRYKSKHVRLRPCPPSGSTTVVK